MTCPSRRERLPRTANTQRDTNRPAPSAGSAYRLLPRANMDNTNLNIDSVINEAETQFRRGIDVLSSWGDQARTLFQDKPGAMVAGIAVAGFSLGMMMRRGRSVLNRPSVDQGADPVVVFLTAMFAGLTIGPRLVKEDTNVHPLERSAELR